MRVISGTARGRSLSAPKGYEVRPTAEKVKEAVFSIIQFELPGCKVLDLFAGTGQMGIEALSRGAESVVFVENYRAAAEIIKRNLESVSFERKARLVASDVFSFLKASGESFDIAFLDPPYGKGLAAKALPLLATIMAENGVIICETSPGDELPEEAGIFKIHKSYKYSDTLITVYKK